MTSSTSSLIAGAVAGLASLSVFVPADLLKCRAQQQKEGRLEYFKEINTVLGEQGVKGMYRGFWASAWRDVPGWAVYFAAFEWLKEVSPEFQNSCHQFLWTLNAGGVAGVISWIFSLPQDIIKTKQQTHQGKDPLSIK